jgi:plastocyanin
MTSTRRLTLVTAVAAVAITAGACGSGSSRKADAAPAAAAPSEVVTIKNFAFSPTPLEAKVGDKVTVTNTDTAAHTLTADDKSIDTGTVQPGASAAVTLTKAGTLTYHCNIHNYMTGVIHIS